MIEVQVWNGDLQAVNDFYKTRNYVGADSGDIVMAAIDQGNIVGAVRLCTENGVLVLRGMQIADNWQRQGVGTAMLRKLDESIGERECFGIPYPHLEKFYGQIGFQFIDIADAPAHLQARIQEYREKKGKEYRMMRRQRV